MFTADFFNFEIYTMNADGSAPARLANNPAVDGEPAWSPDGAKIIFSSNRTGFFNFQSYAMNADGSGQTRAILLKSGAFGIVAPVPIGVGAFDYPSSLATHVVQFH